MGSKVYFCCQWKIEVRRQIVELGTQNSNQIMYIIWLRVDCREGHDSLPTETV